MYHIIGNSMSRGDISNIARIANAVQCHNWLSDNKDCHEFRFSIVSKIWFFSKNLKSRNCFQKSENVSKIWKSSKNLKIWKSKTFPKMWKFSKNLSDQMSWGVDVFLTLLVLWRTELLFCERKGKWRSHKSELVVSSSFGDAIFCCQCDIRYHVIRA